MIIWASKEGFSVIYQQGNLFLNGPFLCTSVQFAQYLVILGYDQTSNLNVLRVWVVVSGKSEHVYYIILHEIIVS
ncbi:hypothetical protein MXB_2528 [Myxobolus squamalis]|nr:hypothetical protein MXB_2528 [Myxobolus squamalis]